MVLIFNADWINLMTFFFWSSSNFKVRILVFWGVKSKAKKVSLGLEKKLYICMMEYLKILFAKKSTSLKRLKVPGLDKLKKLFIKN